MYNYYLYNLAQSQTGLFADCIAKVIFILCLLNHELKSIPFNFLGAGEGEGGGRRRSGEQTLRVLNFPRDFFHQNLFSRKQLAGNRNSGKFSVTKMFGTVF